MSFSFFFFSFQSCGRLVAVTENSEKASRERGWSSPTSPILRRLRPPAVSITATVAVPAGDVRELSFPYAYDAVLSAWKQIT